METTATPPPPPVLLLTTTDIADRIRKGERGACNGVSVWRAIQRLGIQPTQSPGRGQIKLYTEADADAVEKSLRPPNKKKTEASA